MNEYQCGRCGWSVSARHPEGIITAAKDHARDGCLTDTPEVEK